MRKHLKAVLVSSVIAVAVAVSCAVALFEPMLAQSPTVSVRGLTPVIFGAVGDGIADDTSALQEAIDFGAPDASVVYIPRGTYALSAALQMRSNVQLIGESQASTTLLQTDLDEHVIQVAQSAGQGIVSNVEIAHLTLTHDTATFNQNTGSCIAGGDVGAAFDSTEDIYLHHFQCRDIARQGLRPWKTPTRWTVENCTLANIGRGGIIFVDGEENVIRDCRITNTGDDGIGFNDDSHDGFAIGNYIVNAGGIGTVGGRGIFVNGDRAKILGNYIKDADIACVLVQQLGAHVPEDTTVEGNTCDGITGQSGGAQNAFRILDAEGHIRLHGNTFWVGSGVIPFLLQGLANAAHVSIQGNYGTAVEDFVSIAGGDLPSISIAWNEAFLGASGKAVRVADGLTVTRMLLDGNHFVGASSDQVLNFNAGMGTVISYLRAVGNYAIGFANFIRIPSGQTITTLVDRENDTPGVAYLNDVGGSGVTSRRVGSTMDSATCTTPGSVARSVPVYAPNGTTLLGFRILYDGCS